MQKVHHGNQAKILPRFEKTKLKFVLVSCRLMENNHPVNN